MRAILHILTHPTDEWSQQLIAAEQALPDCRIEVVDLTRPEPDYQDLLEKIFIADSVQVW